MNNDFNFQFGMYNPVTDTIVVNAESGSVHFISCKKYNSTVIFEDPNDNVYLYLLAKEQPLTYAKFALSDTGLQDYVNAMNDFN